MVEIIESSEISAIVLAGGRGSRMGGRDKGLIEFAGRPMVTWVLAAIEKRVDRVVISANRNQKDYAGMGYPVIEDSLENFQGPLAGIAAGLQHISTPYVLTVPVDTPILPGDLVDRLSVAMCEQKADLAVAEVEGRLQATHMLFRASLADNLSDYLAGGGRRVQEWVRSQRYIAVSFLPEEEQFRNINTDAELADIERKREQGE